MQASRFSLQVGSLLGYAVSSILLTIFNKMVLTTYELPSSLILVCSQNMCTFVTLLLVRSTGLIQRDSFNLERAKQTLLSSFLYFLNVIVSIAAVGAVSIPEFTVLRRASVIVTLILNYVTLGAFPKIYEVMCVFLMVCGAVMASVFHQRSSFGGVMVVMANNLITNFYLFSMKSEKSLGLRSDEWMFYSSGLSTIPLFWLTYSRGDFAGLTEFEHSSNRMFLMAFIGSSVLGGILNYSLYLCTKFNSPLVTTVTGQMKNVIAVIASYLIFVDVPKELRSILGIVISFIGGAVFTTFYLLSQKQKTEVEEKGKNVSGSTN